MNYHFLKAPPDAKLARALEHFEAQFSYPLGQGKTFSISHGLDYITFFSAIGESTVLVAEDCGQVAATLAAVRRPLRFPDGETRTAIYLADLKIAPENRSAMLLLCLFAKMRQHLAAPPDTVGYAVVMDGTGRTPTDYTGKMRIPAFSPVSHITVLAITTRPGETGSTGEVLAQRSGFVPLGGNPSVRSERVPQIFAVEGASGLLEDTRKGKRLITSGGEEMRAAHLSRFTWNDAAAGGQLIRQAAARCHSEGIPTLFLAVPHRYTAGLCEHLGGLLIQLAPATVFGSGIAASDMDWWIDSAEI